MSERRPARPVAGLQAGAVELDDLQRGQVHLGQAAHVDGHHRPLRAFALAVGGDAAGRAEMVLQRVQLQSLFVSYWML